MKQKIERPLFTLLTGVQKRMSLHMPGGQGKAPFTWRNPYAIDTTELPITDDLYAPCGAIARAEQLMATAIGVPHTLMLTGGSTAGIQTMLRYALSPGDTLIASRNVHNSALHAIINFGCHIVFLPINDNLLSTLEATVQSHPHAKAVLLVSPDYYGHRLPLTELACITHKANLLFLVDEAHGAHLHWLAGCTTAMQAGADLAVQSAHKTLPALTGCAWLHASQNINAKRLRTCLRMVQTSSPSFVLLTSLDDARAYMQHKGKARAKQVATAVLQFEKNVLPLGYVSTRQPLSDPLRVVLLAPQGGFALAEQLAQHHIDVEMADEKHIVCILSILDGEKRLRKLRKILQKLPIIPTTAQNMPTLPITMPERVMPMSQAFFLPTEQVPISCAVGRIAATQAGLYPPGIALITAGERLSQELVDYFLSLPQNRLFGFSENTLTVLMERKECL